MDMTQTTNERETGESRIDDRNGRIFLADQKNAHYLKICIDLIVNNRRNLLFTLRKISYFAEF